MTILAYLGPFVQVPSLPVPTGLGGIIASSLEIGAALIALTWQVWALVKVLGVIAVIFGIVELLFDPKGKERVGRLIANITGGAISVAKPLVNDLSPSLVDVLNAFVQAVENVGPELTGKLDPLFSAIAAQAFSKTDKLLTGEGESTPDRALLAAEIALGNAFGQGAASAGVTSLFESIFPEKLNTLNAAGPIFAEMAGFGEIAGAVRAPLYENAFGKSLQYHYRSIFRPELPDEFDAVLWHARRLLTDDQLRTVFKYSGLKTEYETPYIRSAYRAVQPRAIASAIQDTPFPRAEMQSLLEFAGLRDQDLTLLLDVFETNSVKNVRQQYLNSIITAAERGTLTDADLESDLTDLNFSDQAKHYVRLTVAVRKLEMLLEIYRKRVTILYETSQITDADYVPTLEAAGIANADAEAHYGIDSARLRGKVLLAEERAAAASARRLQAVEAKDAEEQFMTGAIDVIGLGLALTAAGVPLTMVPHLVAIFVARKSGAQLYIFGKLIHRKDAALLREQVAAIEEQTIKKLIAPAQARQALLNLGIPDANAQALVAKWAAQADKVILPI